MNAAQNVEKKELYHEIPGLLIGKTLILFTVFVSVLLTVTAQNPQPVKPLSNQRRKMIATGNGRTQLDSLSIVPSTCRVVGIPDSLYTIDAVNAAIIWKRKPLADSVLVVYRVFPRKLNAPVGRMKYDSIMNNFAGQPYIPDFGQTTREENFFNFGNISYNGSFGRAISFGNSQDAVVTSNLNLQLSGYLADSIEIVAAITDNNIPIQPDGTTQQLNEFDRIFLQFKKKTWQLSLGDIDLRQQQSYFLSFYKRLQGIAFETTSQISDKISNKTLASGSIAKGKFTRNILTPQEGNQGPYRLQGANNELYFIVLANTERVYIDGELMQRGEDQDYVINYNTAEITFTARRMITKDKRIQVEFEYSDRNYLNSNIYLSNETNFNNKAKLRLAWFSNADAKSSPINQTLDAEQKRFLGTVGDNISQALYPSAVLDTFSAGKIMYKKIDTLYNNGLTHDSVFVYSTSPDSARYTLSFIDVGIGNGDYVLDLNGANGKVYRWVEPVSGKKQGQYAAAIFLVTPKKQQVLNVGVDYNITSKTSVSVDGAMSNYDVNTFSKLDKSNDKGYAAKVQVHDVRPLKGQKKLKLVSDLGYEYVQARFKPLERLRNVEFTRDWGLASTDTTRDETIVNAGVQLVDEKSNSLRYQFTHYSRGNVYNGFRNTVAQQQALGNWRFNNNVSLTNVNSITEKGYFLRPTLDVQKIFPRWRNYTLAGTYTVEHNEIRNKATDTIAAQSFSFSNLQVALRSNMQKPNNWSLIWFTRTNAYPLGKDLVRSDRSQNVNMSVSLMKNPHHQFRFTGTYRNLKVLDSSVTSQKAEESLLARAEYQVNEWNGLLTGNVLYEAGAGQEQKRDFSYLEVPAGQGVYTWIDYNHDGIQQLNEFEVALFQDQAKYLRIFTPTNQYVKASYNTFNYSLALNPRSLYNPNTSGSFVRFLGKFNAQSSLQVTKKEISKGLVELNPFKGAVNDTSLLTLSSVFVNTLSFNRFSTKWGLDINNTRNSSKSLLTYGYETYTITDWSIRSRLNLSRTLALELTGKTGYNRLATSSEKFDNRNYKVNQRSLEPKITFTRGINFRVLAAYKFTDKNNELGSHEKYQSHAISSEAKYNILQSTSILGKFTFSNISFKSQDSVLNINTTSAYIMLDGLSPGRNYLWSLDLTKRLSGNLEMSIQYEGRKPGNSRMVHVGRAAIRAIL